MSAGSLHFRFFARAASSAEQMPDTIVFLTGKLAARNLRSVLEDMAPEEFPYDVVRLPINVAGLMTADFIGRHFTRSDGIDRIIVPGRCRGDLDALARAL